ncbi:MAG: hypothetical protein AB7N24_15675 [Dehalococcoidia bacterium]
MTRKVMGWAAAAGLIVGVVSALLAPKAASATNYSVYIELWPGGSSSLTCGWHSGPCYDNDSLVSSGAALDWAPSATINFFVKSSTDSSVYSIAGTGYITSQTQEACIHTMYSSVSDNHPTWRAGVWYYHTDDSLTSHTEYINTQQYNIVSTTKAIGTTADEDDCGDTWSGYHVHQLSDGGWTLASYPDHSTCNVDAAPVTNNVTDCWVSNSYKMGYANWAVAYP